MRNTVLSRPGVARDASAQSHRIADAKTEVAAGSISIGRWDRWRDARAQTVMTVVTGVAELPYLTIN